jgi:3-methyladenine DNA glycosylase AlkD
VSAAEEVRALLRAVADPSRAPAMSAYMKGIAPFLGVVTPARRAATRGWIRSFEPGPRAEGLLGAAAELVTEPEREFAYVAIDLVGHHLASLPSTALPALRAQALTRPWWDTVDAWSAVIGRAALRHPGWDEQVLGWVGDDLWSRRIALVFQVGRREQVDLALLFAACRACAPDRDFFIRKAIGWALRDAARTHPDQVRAFVADARLSPLSVREATKHL